MSWTDERIDLLKRRWTEGLSASQIAGELGGVTRNAVIGKVHRLKLESRMRAPEPIAAESAPATVAPPRIRAVDSRPTMEIAAPPLHRPSAPGATMGQPMLHSVGATALKMEPLADYQRAPEVEIERQSADVVPMSRNLTLIQLSERTCKWPLGDPLSADFRFCGNHAGDASPYCQYHARLAFQPVSERRRAR